MDVIKRSMTSVFLIVVKNVYQLESRHIEKQFEVLHGFFSFRSLYVLAAPEEIFAQRKRDLLANQ
jgi:hypothetical protein